MWVGGPTPREDIHGKHQLAVALGISLTKRRNSRHFHVILPTLLPLYFILFSLFFNTS